ncbi:hypothetical protein ABZ876_11115 [Streptomyces sp. NPDC046931]|uniref:hypothetical protein n=1 Tax=Streptomyces sp. NPDC046931 TaxID=3154806 RepID=UPI0034062D30
MSGESPNRRTARSGSRYAGQPGSPVVAKATHAADYAVKSAPQMTAIVRMVRALGA